MRASASLAAIASVPDLLTVAPTRRELGGAWESAALTRTGVVGIGRAAGAATARLLSEAPCRFLVSLGFAGGLDPRLRPGDVVVASECVDGSSGARRAVAEASYAATLLRRAGARAYEGATLTVDVPLLTREAKRGARERSGALVVDMEGSWIADAAASRGTPLIVVRAALDEAEFALPEFVAEIIADQGRREWMHAARGMRSLAAARGILPLALRSRKAGLALRRAARSIIPALAELAGL